MRGVAILFGLSFAGVTGVNAGPIDIEFSDGLGVAGDGVYVLDMWSGEGLEVNWDRPVARPLSADAVLSEGAEAIAPVADGETPVTVRDGEPLPDAPEGPVFDTGATLVLDAPALSELKSLARVEAVAEIGTLDMSAAMGETLEGTDVPQEFQDMRTLCEGACLAPGLDMLEILADLSEAGVEPGMTDIDEVAFEEQIMPHASLPATAQLLGGALGALAFRRRLKAR